MVIFHSYVSLPEAMSMAIPGSDSLEVPTIYKAFCLGLCKGISPQNMALEYGTPVSCSR